MKKGFTLVELLVVVLIIGILTAVALPKYQTAVDKSRYAGLMPLARSVKNAEEVAYMANGRYSTEVEALDIKLPGNASTEEGEDSVTIGTEDGKTFTINTTDSHSYVKATEDNLANNAYVMYFDKSSNYPKEIHCEARKENERAKRLCLNLANDRTPHTGTDSEFEAYVIEGTGNGTGIGGNSGSQGGGYDLDTPEGRTEAFMDSLSSQKWGADLGLYYNKSEGAYCREDDARQVCCDANGINSDGSCGHYGSVWFEDEYGSYYCHDFYQDGRCRNEDLGAWTFCPVDSSSCYEFSY